MFTVFSQKKYPYDCFNHQNRIYSFDTMKYKKVDSRIININLEAYRKPLAMSEQSKFD